MRQIQQGDVLLRTARSIPAKAVRVPRRERGLVLVEGEHTGHAHVIVDDGQAELYTMDLDMYLRCMSACVVTHEEHGPVTLDPGVYKIERVREHDYLSGMVGPVQD